MKTKRLKENPQDTEEPDCADRSKNGEGHKRVSYRNAGRTVASRSVAVEQVTLSQVSI